MLLWVYIEGARGVQVRVGAGIGARGWGGKGVEGSTGAGGVVCVGQSVREGGGEEACEGWNGMGYWQCAIVDGGEERVEERD